MKKLFAIVLIVAVAMWCAPAFAGSHNHGWKPGPSHHGWKPGPPPHGKKYSCLNPHSTMRSVEYQGLAPRLDSLDGKNILYYQSEANQVIMPVLLEKLRADYPTATFTLLDTEHFGEAIPTEAQLGYDAMIRGICW